MKKLLLSLIMSMLLLPAVCLAHTMPDSEFTFGNITFGTRMSKIKALFGSDMKRIEINNEMIKGVTYDYLGISATGWVPAQQECEEGDLPIRGIRLKSSTVATRSGYVTTPSGFCVGMPYAKVVELFGPVEVFRLPGYPDVYAYEMPGNPGRQMSFTVDSKGIITEISLTTEI